MHAAQEFMPFTSDSAPAAEDYVRAIQAHPNRSHNVFSMVVNGRRVWVKRNRKQGQSTLAQRIFQLLRRAPMDETNRMANEIATMERLRSLGALVPEILHQGEDYMVLSDIGPSLHALMQQNPATELKREWMHKAATALRNLHRRGGAHGNPKLLDLTLHPSGVGFIDFEEAGPSSEATDWQQVRDLWLFTHSTIRFDHTGALAADALEHYGLKPQLRQLRSLVLWSLPLYILLRPFQGILGRDVRFALGASRAILGCKI
jgi:tRNA A-37 threonylcarbamoyl transferase component Bud32